MADSKKRMPRVDFTGAIFDCRADFQNVNFEDHAAFDGARFNQEAWFSNSNFLKGVSFSHVQSLSSAKFSYVNFFRGASFSHSEWDKLIVTFARFETPGDFQGMTIDKLSWFQGTNFEQHANFRGSQFGDRNIMAAIFFQDDVDFSRTRWVGEALFEELDRGATTFGSSLDATDCLFEEKAVFNKVTFSGRTAFDNSKFRSGTFFRGADIRGDFSLAQTNFAADLIADGAVFQTPTSLGPMTVQSKFSLDQVTFDAPLILRVKASQLSFIGSLCRAGAVVHFTGGHVDLEGLQGRESFVLEGSLSDDGSLPRLRSLWRAEVAALTLASMDLQACRFGGAHHLEDLKTEPTCNWPESPSRPGSIRRKTVVEEHIWRRLRRGSKDWLPPECHDNNGHLDGVRNDPSSIAAVYRALRKNIEKSGDVPGAADFYYGEMEMRRHSTETSLSEKFILTLYWLVSGYGMRATRALIAFALFVSLFSLLFWWHGFTKEVPLIQAATYTASLAIAVIVQTDKVLTTPGEAFRIVIRLLGPLTLGLAVLAIRERVKRG